MSNTNRDAGMAVFRHVRHPGDFTIAPKPGGRFAHAAASYTSVFGRVESRWERKDGRTTYIITVPANCEATILLPSGRTETVGAGRYQYTEEA